LRSRKPPKPRAAISSRITSTTTCIRSCSRWKRAWTRLSSPQAIRTLGDVNDLLVEGGAQTAAAFLAADLVDRLLIYRAPILIGDGKPALGPIGLKALADAHGRWRMTDTRQLGIDMREVYERTR